MSARSPLLDENKQFPTSLNPGVWNISADDDEELQRSPFGAKTTPGVHQVNSLAITASQQLCL